MSSHTKPNIVVIWAPDIEARELSCYAGRPSAAVTPNIDRLAREGMMFVNTAPEPGGAAAVEFMSGQSSTPSTLCRAAVDGAPGSRRRDATLAALLRARGYVTGQFGGLRPDAIEDCLVCLDSFDELVGWPRPASAQARSPQGRGAAKPAGAVAELPWWARLGPRRSAPVPALADGAELSDEDLVALVQRFVRRQHALGKPFFAWLRATHTHSVASRAAARARSSRADRVGAHDRNVGELLDLLELLGLADDTFVIYSAEEPRAAERADGSDPTLPSEPGEGAAATSGRPLLVRWPGRIPAGSTCNGVIHARDWLPTLLAVAGEPRPRERCGPFSSAALRAAEACVAGTNVLPFLVADGPACSRSPLTYFDDDGGLLTFRYDNWEVQRHERQQAPPRRAPPPRSGRVRARDSVASPAPAQRAVPRRRASRSAPHRAGAR